MKVVSVVLFAVVLLCATTAGQVSGASQDSLLHRIIHRKSTTTTTTTTPAPSQPLFINNRVPKIPDGCIAHFACSKKLTTVPAPRPCLKYCLKRIECPNNQNTRGKPDECAELDADQVLVSYQEANTPKPTSNDVAATTEKIMEVAMIDFPCQPGYLPDSRGRCREIW